MNDKNKKIIRKIIYGILFLVMTLSFIYLSEKYADNSKDKVFIITDYYKDIKSSKYEVINGSKMISLLKKGKHLIFIGNKNSEHSTKYIKELNIIVESLNIDKVYYYDIVNDKSQKNSNYYEIKDLLKGYLITTDSSQNNLLAPSFYIINEGTVKYYNIETSAMKNTDKLETYWNLEKENEFYLELSTAINKYYLNK